MYRFYFSIVAFIVLLSCSGNNTIGPEPEPKPDHTKGDLVVDLPGGVKMAFIWIEPGTFLYGSPNPVGPEVSQVAWTIKTGFYLGKYEVTQQQWFNVMGTRPWLQVIDQKGKDGDDYPAGNISYNDTFLFFEQLNRVIGGSNFRLPTEAEWEYACRAGTQTVWSFGNTESNLEQYAWFAENSNLYAHIVGTKLPNPWGIYDMHGNVDEWTNRNEWIQNFSTNSLIQKNLDVGFKQSIETHAAVRGGNAHSASTVTKCSSRPLFPLSSNISVDGFRVLRIGSQISVSPN